jgi:hypothetical protein
MAYQPKMRFRLVDNFRDLIARTGVSLRAFADTANVSYSTLQAAINPSQQPNRNPQGGMYAATAWKLAHAYAAIAQLTPDAAYQAIIIEEPVDAQEPTGAVAA